MGKVVVAGVSCEIGQQVGECPSNVLFGGDQLVVVFGIAMQGLRLPANVRDGEDGTGWKPFRAIWTCVLLAALVVGGNCGFFG